MVGTTYKLVYRVYISNNTLRRIRAKLHHLQYHGIDKDIVNVVNSYIGIFSHCNSERIKKAVFDKTSKLLEQGEFLGYYEKYISRP